MHVATCVRGRLCKRALSQRCYLDAEPWKRCISTSVEPTWTNGITEWRNVLPVLALPALPVCALPASVRQLTLDSARPIELTDWPIDVPEVRKLERLVLRASRLKVPSLAAFGEHWPRRLSLQAGYKISVLSEAAAAVVRTARQLVAGGRVIEFCGPSPDCIEVCVRETVEVPSQQQVDELVEDLRSLFVETVHTDAD